VREYDQRHWQQWIGQLGVAQNGKAGIFQQRSADQTFVFRVNRQQFLIDACAERFELGPRRRGQDSRELDIDIFGGSVDQHHANYVLRMETGEQPHDHAAYGVSHQDIGRWYVGRQ
jgi:hypothetical protein